MKKLLLLLLLFTVAFVQAGNAQTVHRLICGSPYQDQFYAVDTATGFTVMRTISLVPLTGGANEGVLGVAKNPNSGTIYVVHKQNAAPSRALSKLNTLTGNLTVIGYLGDNFSSITFRGDSLLGVTGDGATTPETLYMIDTATAVPALLTALGNGLDGEVICYNPSNDLIYHWSGNGTVEFETVLPVPPYTVTPISTTTTSGETFGAVYVSPNKFLGSNISSAFNYWNTNGAVGADLGAMPDDVRGMVFISCTRDITGVAAICAGDPTQLTAWNGISYQWYQNGILMAGETNQNLTVTVPGVYNCIVEDACGTDSLAAGINVVSGSYPVVSLSGGPTVCSGSTTPLTGSSGGTSQWYLNGAIIPGATSNVYNATLGGVYNMIKTNLNGCADSAATGLTLTVINCSGVDEKSVLEMLSIYPNPAHDNVNISFGNTNGNRNVRIVDALGKTVLTLMSANTSSVTINTKNWNNGMYLIHISDEDHTITKRLAITK